MPGITKFTDMTTEEFRSNILMPAAAPVEPCEVSGHDGSQKKYDTSSLPDSFNWADKGAVTPVKDQGIKYLKRSA